MSVYGVPQPILNADTVSSQITGLVFEGLLDLDQDLHLRGRIATDDRGNELMVVKSLVEAS